MNSIKSFTLFMGVALLSPLSFSENSGVPPIVVEAEQAGEIEDVFGNFVVAEFSTADQIIVGEDETEERPLIYIYPNNDYDDAGGCSPNCPGTEERTMTYTATFARAGTYDLYLRYGFVDSNEGKNSGGGGDDSFFFGFGDVSGLQTADWIKCQFIDNTGYTNPNLIVLTEGDKASWDKDGFRWINLSTNTSTGCADSVGSFVIASDGGSVTFSYGAREDGLAIDKFTFGVTGDLFTVNDLTGGTKATGRLMDPIPPIASGQDKFIGGVYSSKQKADFTYFFNQVVSENGGKWGVVERTRDTMSWGSDEDGLDAAVAVSQEGIAGQQTDVDGDGVEDILFPVPFRMHTLLWGNQQPTWLQSLPAADQLTEIDQWFEAVATQYGDKIDVLEVVNEPINDPPKCKTTAENGGIADTGCGNYLDALAGAWTGANTDYAWLKTAFNMARAHFPDAKLMLNEYNILNSAENRAEYKNMIQALKDENLIDVIGVQGHAFETTGTAEEIKAALDDLATLGLDIHITEMDIDGAVVSGCANYDPDIKDDPATEEDERVCIEDAWETDDALQLANYKKVFKTFWEHDAVKGITLWGHRAGLWRNTEQANIVSTIGEIRPAGVWLRSYVNGENTLPVIADAQLSVESGTVMGIEIGRLSATDADVDSSISGWLIVGGTGADVFEIDMDPDTSEGRVFVSVNATEGVPASAEGYTLDVVAMDNTYMDSPVKTITISVTEPDPDAPAAWEPVEKIENISKGEGGGAMNCTLLLLLSLFGLSSLSRRINNQ